MEKLIEGAASLGLNLTSKQLEQFHCYYRELVDWNRRINLTRIVDYEEVQIKHFLDSLTITLALQERLAESDNSFKVMDVGTGAGLPGIPLKILFNEIKLALLDSVAKKTAFLHHLINQLGLEGIDIITGRAEELAHHPQYREQFSVVLSRAVAKLPTLVELTLPFCQVDGVVIVQKKGKIGEETTRATKAMDALGGKLREVKKIDLVGLLNERYLVIIDKAYPTPKNYPRRPDIPERRPIK